jgi:hypothetical protein
LISDSVWLFSSVSPTVPMLAAAPASVSRLLSRIAVYRADSTGGRNTGLFHRHFEGCAVQRTVAGLVGVGLLRSNSQDLWIGVSRDLLLAS